MGVVGAEVVAGSHVAAEDEDEGSGVRAARNQPWRSPNWRQDVAETSVTTTTIPRHREDLPQWDVARVEHRRQTGQPPQRLLPGSHPRQPKDGIQHKTLASAAAAVTILRHLYSFVDIKYRGDPQASPPELKAQRDKEEQAGALVRLLWADLQQTLDDDRHKQRQQYLVLGEIISQLVDHRTRNPDVD
ncbi:hypothetical protein Micbo1qcDRAFT_213711 [Microdochium bolleyi]|uniref:Uncharacterized protein n=1 Tax=Microdochium bolleyi TaxID=196109 RepID=A0A136IUP5_9PEZI|nr:hypothetical protein Micbo1qcDRAFT_213711 [Microdochium bolleyi]